MKKETSKKSKLGLIIAIAVIAVLAIAGVVLALTLGGSGSGNEGDVPEKIESKLYWNIDRAEMLDEATSLTKRVPGSDGLYHIRFMVEGEEVELLCADKKLVNRIELLGDVIGLAFDTDGLIIEAYKATDVATLISENAYVQNPDGNKVTLNSSAALNGMETTVDLSGAAIYNMVPARPEVPGRDFKLGQKDELKLMDSVLIYGSDENTPHTVFIITRLYDSEVYWRAEAGQFNSTTKMSTRQPAKDGFWYMDFLCNGETVTLRTKSQPCIDVLDAKAVTNAATGLVFNHEGDIVDVFNAGLAVKGKVVLGYDVTGVEGNMITTTRKLSGTELGRTYTFAYSDEIPVYNVTTTADKFGELTKEIRVGDRLLILVDASGKIDQIFMINRMVDSPMYYNVSPSYNSTTLETNRKPDADGYYHIQLAVNGKLKEFRCKSKAVMTQIDAYGNRVFGLKVRGDLIVKAYNPECVTGAYSFAANNWVTSVAGGIVGTVNASGTAINGIMADDCKVYDVSGCSAHLGAKTTLRVGDRIVAYNDADAMMRYVYVISRKVSGVSLYWNFEKKYNAATGETTRTPDADGYYVFRMAKCGSAGEKLMKTKDKEIASKIDKTGVYALCMKAKGDIIQAVYPATAINGGYSRIFGIYTTQRDDETHYGAMFYTTGAKASIDISLAKIYNVSGVYKKGAGEKTTLQPNDRLMLLYGPSGKAEHIIVWERECGSSAYWQFNPNYNAKARTTLPDADGYYNYTVTSQGKIKNVKTKDKDLAAYMDGRFLAFGLKLDGDIIKGAYSATATKEIATSAQSFYDVAKINGNKITLERTVPGSSNTGDVQEINISKAKVYNVSAYAGDAWGKTAKLGVGDRVQTYKNEKDEITLVYIVWENTREAGHKSYCEHCKQEVVWHPYYGTIDFIDKHYYLPADYAQYYSKGWGIQGRTSGWDWVLDLNGFTYEATGSYAFAIRGNSKLTVVDTSKAKTGRITGVGVQIKDANGNKSQYQSSQAGIFSVLDNGTLNLRGGTYTRTVNREITNLRRAGVAIVEKTGTLNIYDGAKLVNNEMDVPLDLSTTGTEVRRAPQGGAIYNNGGVVNIYGGLIANNGKVHADFKEYETASGNGGNIFQASGTLNISGGKISGGWCVGNGGNIYVNGGKLTIAGGEISGGTSVNADTDNLIVAANKNVEVNITGGKITGGTLISAGNTLKISGKPEITMGEDIGLSLGSGMKAQVGTMKDGAKVVISSSGTFTTDFATKADAEAMLARNIFVGVDDTIPFYVNGKALACGKEMCLNGHVNKDECDAANCDKEIISWTPWKSGDSLPTTGNYYLTENVTIDARVAMSGNVNLDLNGKNITRVIESGAADYGIYTTNAKGNLYITDLSGGTVGTVKTVFDTGVTTCAGTGFLGYVGAGYSITIDKGNFDFRGVKTTASATTGAGAIIVDGALTINGGTFYGANAGTTGYGTVIGGRSAGIITINGGTFYGNNAKQGGIISTTGNLTINGGLFDGNTNASNGKVDSALPQSVATHGGLFYVVKTLTINGGEFKAGRVSGSGGIAYVTGSGSVVSGGTFTAGGQTNYGGFFRFDGSATISGVTLTGGKATTNGNNISFCGANSTLTIGQDAVIDGGIMFRTDKTGNKLVLLGNAKVNGGAGAAYSLNLANTSVHIGFVDNEAVATVGAAFMEYRATYDAEGNVNGVKNQIQWNEWNAAAAATMYSGAEADNLHLTKLPTAGSWKLTDNVTLSALTTVTGDLKLNLNGFNVTRVIGKDETSNTYILKVNAGMSLYITDEIKDTDPAKSVGTMATVMAADRTAAFSSGCGMFYTANASGTLPKGKIIIDDGIFDGRGVTSTTTATTGSGLFQMAGELTINGGTFYGIKAANGYGTVIGGQSSSNVVINNGTFYGNAAKQGGILFSSGIMTIKGGTFDGNSKADKTKVNSALPLTSATHGSLINIAATGNLTIEGGDFKAGAVAGSGGIGYIQGTATISGGTYALANAATYGGFFRFDKDATVTGVTFSGGTASTHGNNISFGSNGNATLTIGQDAVIDGGIETRADKTGNKVVLVGNAKVNSSNAAKYSLKLANVTVHIGSKDNAAVATVGATAANYLATYTGNNVTGVQAQ